MSYQLTNASGAIEAVIDDNCSIRKFHSIANLLSSDLHIHFVQKTNNSDTSDWLFVYKDHPMLLHFNVYNGVSICAKNRTDNEAAFELAALIEQKCY